MPITKTTTDYSNRKKDLYISQGINPLKEGLQAVTYSFGKQSAFVAGVQKLIQRYIIALVNTGVIRSLQANKAANVQEAMHLFNFASWAVIKQFRDYQNQHTDLLEDEQLATAQLQSLVISGDHVNISVKLVTKAGEDVPFVLPLPLR